MEELLKQLIANISEIKETVSKINGDMGKIEQRLDRLEKVDSIEHRVSVNQIDLSDIKDIVEKIEKFQKEEILPMTMHMNDIRYAEEILKINNRLDCHMAKIAKNEEDILMLAKSK